MAIIGFCLLFLMVGVWRHQTAWSEVIDNELKKYNDIEQEVTLIGIVSKEPDVRENKIKLTIEIKKINEDEVEGRVLATTRRYPEYQYGDKLEITGELLTPPVFEDFNYRDFLAKDGIYSVMSRPQIKPIKQQEYRDPISIFYAKILEFKDKLRKSIEQNLSPPQSSILGAMILGDKRRMSEELKEKLNITGVRHITAISGMHIVILSVILMQFLIGLGLWRGQAFYLTLAFIVLFIVMVGLPSSAIRAGIMAGLFLWAQKIGRLSTSSRALIFAGAGMLALNPLLLRLDVGFQLSFLAIIGIISFAPIFQNWFKKIPDNLFGFIKLRSIIAMTFSAQIFTLPILVYNFGRISLIAPITNILILPLIPFILGIGFLFGIVGTVWQTLGWVLSWPAWLLLTYLFTIVDWFSQIPLAALTLQNVHWAWLVIAYLVLGSIAWWLNEREKLKFLKY